MKEIIAVIRPKMVNATKAALEKIGYPSITAIPVLGRGKQRGIADEVDIAIRPNLIDKEKSGGMKYIPKRQVMLVVQDEDVEEIVKTLIEINKTGQFGDGKIFVCPVEGAVRIRTGEKGKPAIL